MPYRVHTDQQRAAMLTAIGSASLDELFAAVPAELRCHEPLQLPPAMSELELQTELGRLGAANVPAAQSPCFLGAGSYDHFIPAVVDFVASRSEFYTAYTPYQPEASQGTLQAVFEYQTLITQLTGMAVANASLYDGASALAEAVLMARAAAGKRRRVVVAESVHPEYRAVLATYLANLETEIVGLSAAQGAVIPDEASAALDDQTICLVVQHPNFFGSLEEMDALAEAAHRAGAQLIVVFDPISLGLLRRPGDYGADIAVAEGQPLGIPMSFGGPGLGILACSERFMRRLPGRVAGQTVDRQGNRCWVLTLQTREQHIRREKATSNICTNQGLMALRAAVYLAAMGPQGLRETAALCLQKTRYAAQRLTAANGLSAAFDRPVFKEFVVCCADGRTAERIEAARRMGLLAGVALGRWYASLADCLLVAVTEKRTRAEIDQLAEVWAG